MANYVVCSGHLIASKTKGELPDVIYQYVANDSHVHWHYTFTNNIDDALCFDESEKEEAKEIANLCNMKVKRVDG